MAILGPTRDTSAEAIRYLLGFLTMAERHQISQVEVFLRVATEENHPFHTKIDQRPTSRIKKGSERMTESTNTLESCLLVES